MENGKLILYNTISEVMMIRPFFRWKCHLSVTFPRESSVDSTRCTANPLANKNCGLTISRIDLMMVFDSRCDLICGNNMPLLRVSICISTYAALLLQRSDSSAASVKIQLNTLKKDVILTDHAANGTVTAVNPQHTMRYEFSGHIFFVSAAVRLKRHCRGGTRLNCDDLNGMNQIFGYFSSYNNNNE